MISKTFKTTIVRNGSICFIPLTFDPREVFGKVRAPVKVTAERLHLPQHDRRDGWAAVRTAAEEQPGSSRDSRATRPSAWSLRLIPKHARSSRPRILSRR